MADALKFMLELVDRMTKPATSAAASVGKLEQQLRALKRSVGELAAMPDVKIKAPQLVGAKGSGQPATKPRGPLDSRGFEQSERQRVQLAMKLAAEIERAKKREDAAYQRSVREHQKASNQQVKIAERGKKELEKAQKIAQRNVDKNAKSAERAALLQKKAMGETATGAFKQAFSASSSATQGFDMLGSAAGALLNPVGLAVAAVLALVAALVGLAAALKAGASLAIEASEAKNDTLDMLEAMLGTAEAANETYAALSAMTGELAASQAQLSASAQELAAAGVDSQAQLLASVKAIAQVDSVLKGSGAKVQGIIEKAVTEGKFKVEGRKLAGTGVQIQTLYAEIGRRMKIGVDEVEKQMKAGKIEAEVGIDAMNAVISQKFGPLAAKQAMDFGAQMTRLKDNISKLFEDVDTGPFLEGISKIVAVFDKTTPAGAALRHVLTTVFDGLFAAASRVLPYVSMALRGLVLIGLKVWNALRPLGKAIADTFGGQAKDGPKSFSDGVIKAADAVGKLVAAFVGLATEEGNWRMITAVVRISAFAFETAWKAIVLLIGAIITLETWGLRLNKWFADLRTQAQDAGIAIIEGLVGVLSNPERLFEVVTNLAKGALGKFKSVFGISSPSKVMMGFGGDITEGLARGIDSGARAANDNMQNVVSIESARARAEAAPTPMAATQGGGTSITIQLGENAVVINGANLTMEEVRDQFPSMFADAVELMLLSQGGGASVGRTGT